MTTERSSFFAFLFLALLLLAFVGWRLHFFSEMPRPLSELYLDVVPDDAVAIAPDGRALAYAASYGDDTFLQLRTIGAGRVSRFPGTKGASMPFFSSDGRDLGFFAAGALRRLALETGEIAELARVDSVSAAIFLDGGVLLFGSESGLTRVSAPDRAPELLSPQPVRGLASVAGSDWILVEVENAEGTPGIEALSLTSLEAHILQASGSHPRFAPSGHLLFLRDGALYAQKMDPLRAELSGRATVVLPEVSWFDLAENGTLAYRSSEGPRPSFRVVAHWVEELKRISSSD